MNAEVVLATAKAAHAADRPLTADEFQAIRNAINDPATDLVVRGGLQALGDALRRQADNRIARQQVEAELERGRERMRQLEARQARWQALDLTVAAIYRAIARAPREPALRMLLEELQRPDRGEPPRSFEPEQLSEYDRMIG